VFDDAGHFSVSNQGAFTHHLKTGHFKAGEKIGPYHPKHKNSHVNLDFKDEKTNETMSIKLRFKQYHLVARNARENWL
jgi:hypothetical protein